MSNDNLQYWDRFADIDPKFTKPITGKSYKGTSPNPQYVIRCLTELFGPAGKGFGWEVKAEEFRELMGETIHWCRIRFWWRDNDGEHGVEEYGQTKAAYTTKSGTVMVDEDAPKKSLTDAIIKGASHVGVAANIFIGRWDDQKYVAEVNAEYRQAERGGEKKEAAPADKRDWFLAQIGKAASLDMLNTWWDRPKIQEALETLHPAQKNEVRTAFTRRVEWFAQAPQEAAE